jgi:hypothetical protein
LNGDFDRTLELFVCNVSEKKFSFVKEGPTETRMLGDEESERTTFLVADG